MSERTADHTIHYHRALARQQQQGPVPPPLPPHAAPERETAAETLPFTTHLSLAAAAYSLTASRLLLLVVLVCIVRVPKHHSELHTVLRWYLAAVLAELLWRRACRHSPHGGSYARWRHLALPAFALCDVLMSRHRVVRAGLDITAADPQGGLWDALHHLLLLVLSSRVTSNLFVWALCHRAQYMLPAQLAIVYHHWRANVDSCAAAVLAEPSAVQHTHRIAEALAKLQLGGAAHVLLHRPLTPAEECGTVVAWQQLMFGLALPLLAQLALESRLWVQHQAQRRRRGLPPERSRLAPLYHVVHSMADLDIFHALVLFMLLSSTLHHLAVAISIER